MSLVVWVGLDGQVGRLRRARAARVVLEVSAVGSVERGDIAVADGDREVLGAGIAVIALGSLATASW